MGWAARAFDGIDARDAAILDALTPARLAAGTRVFAPGETAQGFAVVRAGRIEVSLTGPTGREILLYAVEPGQTCVQTTLGLLGEEPYSGEAICVTDVEAVIIPAPLFRALMLRSGAVQRVVFRALAGRMNDLTALLERVAFVRIETRLAQVLTDLSDTGGTISATHAELAARIGSSREVVSRRLEAMARRGLLEMDRGRISVIDGAGLRRLGIID